MQFQHTLKAVGFVVGIAAAFSAHSTALPPLDAVKINSAGTYAAGNAVPTWLAIANTLGAFAGKWGSPIAIGSSLVAAALSDYQSPAGQLKLFPSKAVMNSSHATPSGWTDSNTPPSTSPVVNSVVLASDGKTYPSAAAACQACDVVAIANGYGYKTPTVPVGFCNDGRPGMWSAVCTYNAVQSCSSGYKLSGSTCVVDEPTSGYVKWPDYMDDGPPDGYLDAAGIWRPNPRNAVNDNFCYSNCNGSKPTAAFASTFGTSNPLFRSGTDSHGNPTVQTITPNGTNGFSVEQLSQGNGVPLADGSTPKNAVEKQGFSMDSNGTVSNVWYSVTNNSTINNITGSVVPNSQQMDTTGLATSANQQTEIANQTAANTKLDDIKLKLAVTENIPADQEQILKDKYNQIIDGLPSIPGELAGQTMGNSLVPPTFWDYSAGTCYPAEFDAGQFGHVSLERFCYIYDTYIRDLIAFMIWCLGVIGIFHTWADYAKEI